MLDHAEILGVENIGSSLILVYRHILARSRLLHNGVFPAARMGTGTLVRVAARKEVAEQASSGVGNAHRAVDEALDLHVFRDMCTDLFDLL